MTIHPNPKTVLILGGGENLASREVLKHLNVRAIDVVDIDSTIFNLSKKNKLLLDINKGASKNAKVNLIVDDAFIFLKNNFKQYDIIISDLPDPSNDAIARLYSKHFFMLVKKNLHEKGIFVTQSGEIYYSNQAFSCIKNTVNEVFKFTKTYQTYVPSFGNWGFTIAANFDFDEKNHRTLPNELKYLTDSELANSFVMPKDILIKKTK